VFNDIKNFFENGPDQNVKKTDKTGFKFSHITSYKSSVVMISGATELQAVLAPKA
jgi:hypothetical protein